MPVDRSLIRALLFDLGGVVIEIDFARAFRHWSAMSSLSIDAIRSAFHFDVPYQRHEMGELSAEGYFDSLRTSLGLHGSDDEIRTGWNSIFVREVSETVRAIRKARARYPCFAFTNSNPTHKSAWHSQFPAVVAAFDRVFVSSEIGLRKPDRAAFEHIAAAIGVPVSCILFFDDSLENVQGAVAAGLQAVHVASPRDTLAALADLGCEI